MQAIEFEATTFQHTIRVPDDVPDGVFFRVLLLAADKKPNNDRDAGKRGGNLLALMPDVGSDRRPEYLTLTVNEIEMPTRDERYERYERYER